MSTSQSKNLGNLVEQKILEFFGDPDTGLKLKKNFLTKLRAGVRKKKLVSHADVLKRYGLR